MPQDRLDHDVRQAIADKLKEGKRPITMSAGEEAVYQFCIELSLNHRVSDPTFNALKKIFSEQQIVDLIVISGEHSNQRVNYRTFDNSSMPRNAM